jgi:hypothetical protein
MVILHDTIPSLAALGDAMHRTYQYKEFIVDVETEAARATVGNLSYVYPKGYVAVVHIRRERSPAVVFEPKRLDAGTGRPFSTESDALMAGFTAAQRTIDDTLRADG